MRAYPYDRYRNNLVPVARLSRPLAQSRLALVTTAGLHLPDQPPFEKKRGGDCSFRVIPSDCRLDLLLESHKSDAFDHTGITADRNLALPLERFRELEQERQIGSLSRFSLSFMGSITEPTKLIEESAPMAAELLLEDGVEAAFLTPV